MGDLLQVLHKTISENAQDQSLALEYLRQASEANFPEFVRQLSVVLRNTDQVTYVRQAAGLQLKNVLVAKDDELRFKYLQRWSSLAADIREFVKKNVLETLGTEATRPSTAAQCVAGIACAELPAGSWQECIAQLMQNVTNPSSTEALKESCLEALGYICQDIDPSVLSSRSNEILTAIVHGMKQQEPSNHVRLAATQALGNSLEFTRANFENENERNVIMQVVCEATQVTDTGIRVAALQSLVKIMSLYYQLMEPYMRTALFPITLDAMKSAEDEVCLQGIEFWSNVCDEELELACEAEEAAESGRPPEHVSKFYSKGALEHIVPILTETLARQDEGDDEDEWNPAKAAGVCLMLMAQCVGDLIIGVTIPFITVNINHDDWRFRDAAVMAFGSILEGPDASNLKPLLFQAMPLLIQLLNDRQTVVRDSTAWCIGRVCDICQDVVVNQQILELLLPALSQGLTQEPRVAANVCWAISSLASAAYDQALEMNASSGDDDNQPDTYILSPCFEAMVDALLKTTDRPDAHLSNLRNAAYEALMELIKNSPKDCYVIVQKTTVLILKKLESLLAMENAVQSSSDRSQFHDLQSLLCATLQSVLRKMRKEDTPTISNAVMQALLQIMSHSLGKAGGVMEDALMAMSTLIEVMGETFAQYMEAFKPFLIMGLKNHAEYQVCMASVGIIGDLCRSLEANVVVYVDEIMQLLLELLTVPNIDKSIRPQVLSTFGDIALALGPGFVKFLPVVLQMLAQATTAEVDKSDYDAVDYLNQLRESCMDAYTMILQGFKGPDNTGINADVEILHSQVGHIITFIEKVHSDNHPSDSLLGAAAGLIGDLATSYGASILPALERESMNDLLQKGRKCKNGKAKTLANWATKEIKKLKSAATGQPSA